MRRIHLVTGAFGYAGRHIASHLVAAGIPVRTFTRRAPTLDRHSTVSLSSVVEARSFGGFEVDRLARELRDVAVLYNTYWVRFARGETSHRAAVQDSQRLLLAAKRAGVPRVVHISITNPSPDSELPYFRGKAEVERALCESGLSHAILRPAVLFGGDDVLFNNIAWLLRRAPLFLIPGDGQYRLQPIHVDDLARLAVEAGQAQGDQCVDAVGGETFTYEELVRLIAAAVGSRARVVRAPPVVVWLCARLLSVALGDVLLTRDEIIGLMDDLLVSSGRATGATRFTEWLPENAEHIGRCYASELQRHYLSGRHAHGPGVTRRDPHGHGVASSEARS